MKKLSLLFVVLLLTASVTFAQKGEISLRLGVNGMYNVGETDFGEMFQNFVDAGPGYQIGLEYNANLVSLLGFRGEINYVNGRLSYINDKQVSELPNGELGNFSVTEIMSVVNQGIQIPASLTLDFGLVDVNVGPNFEFLVSSVATGNLTAINIDSIAETYTGDIDYDFFNDPAGTGAYFDQAVKDGSLFNMFNIGINLGAGVNLGKLRLDLRTNYTLTDAVNDYYQSTQEGETPDRPISFQLTAIYQIFEIGGGSDEDDDLNDNDEPEVDVLYGTKF